MHTNTINTEQFSALLKENEEVYELITTKDISILKRYPELKNVNQVFLDWLSPQYAEAFIHIFSTFAGTKQEKKLVKLLNTPFYCNSETEEIIIDFLCTICQKSLDQSQNIYEQLMGNDEDFIPITDAGGFQILTDINISIFNTINHSKIHTLRNETIELSLRICEKLKKLKVKDPAYLYFEYFIVQIPKLRLSELQQATYNSLKRKKNQKSILAYIGSGLILILIILRFLSKVLD